MNEAQVKELLLQSLEHERGGIKVYQAAIACAVNPDLKREWTKYLEETRKHEARLEEVCQAFGIDPDESSPGRAIVHYLGGALVEAMKRAKDGGDPAAAELVACECVVLAETKDHLNWQLIGKCAEHHRDERAQILKGAYDEIEDQEDEHLYHTKGWCRELWVQSLGINAVLPPPEERLHVKTAIGAARAEQAAEKAR